MKDRYGHTLTTRSAAAVEAYLTGCDLLLSANAGSIEALGEAVSADPGFAAAHMALARAHQSYAQPVQAKAAKAEAVRLAAGSSEREQSQIAALAALVEGRGGDALAAIRTHIARWPRDAIALQPVAGVFGLIGFSGRAGREAELYDMLSALAAHYEGDWWFGSALAFAEVETGRVAQGLDRVERSLAVNPRNANGAHVLSHAHYEAGDRTAGVRYLADWLPDYARESALHCHLNWHLALWSLEAEDAEQAWRIYHADLAPGAAWGPPINVLTDAASFLFRAAMQGEVVEEAEWRRVSRYALDCFPEPGAAFVDIHAALAHAMAGDASALERNATATTGAASDVVVPLAMAFAAIALRDWPDAVAKLTPVMAQHERLGGSRAQRDLIEYALAMALLRSGRADEARAVLARRSRNLALLPTASPVAGLY